MLSLWFSGPLLAAELNRLAFGSCNHAHLAQPMWSVIESHQPDLFLWAGDVIYADTTDPALMKRKYQQQKAVPAYKRFTSRIPVIGIWDDHDYGINNGGKNNPIKALAQQHFLDFVGEPEDSVRRRQQGIYTSYNYGSADRQVKIILLDTRYHMDRPGIGRADLLGDEQWRWLEKEIQGSTAEINFIVSSISVLSDQIPVAEEWNDYKWARKRLFKLIEKHQLPGVMFLTGDRHFSAHLTESVRGRRFHELMSSGLTHYLHRKRVSRVFRYYYGAENSYFGLNFGLLDIDWGLDPVRLAFRVYGKGNRLRVERFFELVGGRWVD